MSSRTRQHGLSYVELLMALAVVALIFGGLQGVVGIALQSQRATAVTTARLAAGELALAEIARIVGGGQHLLLPLADNSLTPWPEHVREQTAPPTAGAAQGAVLAVSLAPDLDRDGDGWPDADDDHDGRVDEDWPADINADGAAGVRGADDDGDGQVDESSSADDDESGTPSAATADEDSRDGADTDGDGSIDDDPAADMNGDSLAGVAGVDDDGDGVIDEGAAADDDEDGATDEDGLAAVVLTLVGDSLVVRNPVPWDSNGDGSVDRLDTVDSVLATDVVALRVERLPTIEARVPTVAVQFTLRGGKPGGAADITLSRVMRLGQVP